MKFFKFAKQVYTEFSKDKGGTLSAAFAYFAIFAIGPLLLVLISIVGFVLGEKAANGQLFTQLSDIIGPNAARTIQSAVAHTHQIGGGAIALIVGIIGTILAAIGLSNQLQNSFDIIFDAVPDPKSNIKRTFYTKFKNLILLAVTGFVVLVSIVLSTIVTAVGERLHQNFNIPTYAVEAANNIVSLLIFITILYLIYKVLPDVKIPPKVVLSSAVVVSLLFLLGKIVLGFVIGRNATASAYGAAASIITLLLWFYYTAQILLLGAEGIKVYGDNHALMYDPKKYTLKRRVITLDLGDDMLGRSVDKFIQGFQKKRNKN